MTVATFDTYAAAKTLREAGFDEAQAEAAVAMVRDAVTEGVATKTDIARLEAKIAAVRAELGGVKWVLGLLSALTLAVVGRLFGAF